MPKIFAAQLDTVWHDACVNRDAAADLLASQSIQPGSLIVLPEMFDVGFTMETDISCAATLNTVAYAGTIACVHQSTIVFGHAARDASDRAVNVASVIDPEHSTTAHYVKCHPFTPAGEHQAYAAGDGPMLFEWAGLKVAPLICYDLRFPELFRAAVKLGAEVFVVIANWPVARVEHWITLAKARAIENQAYVVAVNRCGRDPNYAYPGRSLIIDPHGEVLAEAGDGAEVISAGIDPTKVRDWRRDFPALRDARLL